MNHLLTSIIAVAMTVLAWPAVADAQPMPWHELTGDEPPLWWDYVANEPPLRRASSDLSLSLRWVKHPKRQQLVGGMTLTLPLEPLASRPKAKARPARSKPEVEPQAVTEPEPPPHLPPDLPLPRFDTRDVGDAIDEAVFAAGLERERERIANMASRARWSSALPQLRLRATRLVDESASISPTSYDPNRTTESGGVSLWLEARASWSLDRAIFATEEIRLADIGRDIEKERLALQRRVLDLMFGWQAAVADLLDPTLGYRECREAWLREQRLAAELDLVTRGWFRRWRNDRDPLPDVDCAPRGAY